MTQEEKAKAYDEALERARAMYDVNYTDSYTKANLETIFPELRESEDERTRNEIIAFIEQAIHRGGGTSIPKEKEDKWLAYLEKQKEKKFDFELIKQAWYMEGYKDRDFETEPRWIIKTGEGGPEYEPNPKYGQPLAKMQKPATFNEPYNSDEYEVVEIGNATCLRRKEQKSAEIDFEDWDTLGYIRDIVRKHVRRDEEFNVLDKWLTEHYVNQKSAWGEEDEKMVRFYEDDYDNNLGNMPMCDVIENRIKFKDWLLNRLKSIRPQPKQEWSEEDEKMKERLITRLNWITYNTRTDGTSPNITFFDEIAWLKTLRPNKQK